MQKIKTLIANNKNILYILAYVAAGSLAIGLYPHAKQHMIVQDAWLWIIKSNATFNFILFYFLWGIGSDKFTKHMPKWKSWTIFIIGLILITAMFRIFGGMNTIFDK